jgi:oxygen-independent coproporphyrinogen-3 oxidase
MEGYFELVVETLVDAGYRWYETANFCRPGRQARHNLGYWLGEDYLGIGIGAVSTVSGLRWRNRPSLAGYLGALAEGGRPPRDEEPLEADVVLRERLLLGLRLDEPVVLSRVGGAVDLGALARMEQLGLAERRDGGLALTRRGRFLGGGVTAELMIKSPAKSTL